MQMISPSPDRCFLGMFHSRFSFLNDIEHDFVVYLTWNTTNCVWSKIVTRDKNETIKIQRAESSLLTDFVSSKRDKRFEVESKNRLLNN